MDRHTDFYASKITLTASSPSTSLTDSPKPMSRRRRRVIGGQRVWPRETKQRNRLSTLTEVTFNEEAWFAQGALISQGLVEPWAE